MNARDFALLSLDQKRLPGWKANLCKSRGGPPHDPRDRALADRIINGVVKNVLMLQGAIEHFSAKPLERIDPVVGKILAIALCQLRFLDRVPSSAAVDQAVEQTKRFGRRSASGFVNAVMRNVERRAWPIEPDAAMDPEAYAERVLSHPRELFRRLVESLGTEKALAFCRHDNAEPPTIVRLFKGVGADELARPDIEIVPHAVRGLSVVRGAKAEILHEWAARGLGQVQDATAASVVNHLWIAEGMRMLDRCAGLGTKTLQIWERAGATAEIVAMDASAFRCDELRKILSQRGIKNIKVVEGAKMTAGEAVPFDRILIDVPCSNSGVLARRPEARYRGGVDCLAKIQREILEDTLSWLSPGGILVYSTCSVWPEENSAQIAGLLARNPKLELIEEKTIWPSFETDDETQYHDGGYVAVLRSSPNSV